MLIVAVFRSQSAPLKQERFRFIAEFYQEFLVGKVVEPSLPGFRPCP
jgi:hypothetical protein